MLSASVAAEINSVAHKVQRSSSSPRREHGDTDGFLISTAHHPSEERAIPHSRQQHTKGSGRSLPAPRVILSSRF